ncbi:phage tail protein [Citrobacter sp. Cpo035]|uniref:phage tail protein n=1 Tax=Citrobacter sp. Cpo035 TaxID=2985124 RepID=UPI0025768F31|nr:phage tail protein [Citrobacter sp. Cpo035]MDM2912964.1 phage tail protein [Citrobacter sp. Cpo035]
MIKDWLKKQLIPEKQETGLWPDFADAVQVVYEAQVKPLLSRLSDRKSFFTMHPEDMDTRISEYGRFFVMGETDKVSRPILLAQRLDEVHFKGTDRPIVSTFWREFGNLPVNWEPLYAPLDQERFPYGTFFTTENGVKIAQESYGDFFLTSRGTINVDLNKLYEIYGYEEQDELIKRLIKDVDRIVAPLLPLETVFDGISLRLDFWLEEAEEVMKYASATVGSSCAFLFQPFRESIELQHVEVSYDAGEITPQTCSQDPIYLRLDTMPVDAWPLDLHILNRG